MNELEIILSEINPQDFFGTKNVNLELLESYFPKLKIVARGNKIKAYGENSILNEFKRGVDTLCAIFSKNNFINPQEIERILSSNLNKNKLNEELGVNIIHGIRGNIIKAKTPNQIKLVNLISDNDMVFAVGPAGTGKTYTGIAMAVRALKEKSVKRIILTRPAVEAGENLGFLPGDLKEKLDPYMQPLYDALKEMIPHEKLKSYIEKEIIQIAPLAFMRGRTLDNAFVILDEAQNTSHSQMKMFLTRMGTNAKFLITGDPGQIDLPRKLASGLKEALSILNKVKGIAIITLNDKDIIRNKIVKKVIEAYNKIES
ncbi:MAG: phosphate starvation-inducible protein PhoH [Flavobacteriaceae bacterium]|nr:phosphate starvation-inducible protein PhoH [Flavobacteriaceae bacterium]